MGSRGKHLADAAHSMPGNWKPSCQPGAGSARLALSGWNGECKEVVVAFSPSSVAALPSSSPQEGAALNREEQGAVASAAKELPWAFGAKKRSVVKAFFEKRKPALSRFSQSREVGFSLGSGRSDSAQRFLYSCGQGMSHVLRGAPPSSIDSTMCVDIR